MSTSIFVPAKAKLSFSYALQVLGCTLAVLCSAALIWLAHQSLFTCYNSFGICGTPCVTTSFDLLVAPLVLSLPFVRLLGAKNLSVLGLLSRCAVTSGIGVWVVSIVIIWSNGSIAL